VHRREGKLIVSATDLVAFLECGHLTRLDLAEANGLVERPFQDDPTLELLRRRGGEHEQRYVAQLRADGRQITDLDGQRDPEATIAAMRRGDDVIFQATIFDGRWIGHPDFLLRLPTVAETGTGGELGADFHYTVADTKLAHTAKASALIQICSYVDQVERIQGVTPETVAVVLGGAEIKEDWHRTAEMMAYYRHAKARFEQALAEATTDGARLWPIEREVSYPDPVEHCDVCRWTVRCRGQWRDDDALPLVAGIMRSQRVELRGLGVETRRGLATAEVMPRFTRVREQARLQVESEDEKLVKFEFLEPERDGNNALVADRGLSTLPMPSVGDLFFDIEGDPFAFHEGLEYLFGVWQPDGEWRKFWAKTRAQEKVAFEAVIGLFESRLEQYPDMHVYHYGSYEPSRLKLLAGRHATCEEQLDGLLRRRLFVDLYRVVRQGVRVGAERYSIKNLEPLYGFERTVELREANKSIVEFELYLETGSVDEGLLKKIEDYNRDDCISTQRLRDWLEERRPESEAQFGLTLPRPPAELPPPRPLTPAQERVRELELRLTDGIPTEPTDRTDEQQATWLLAQLLDWHRREDKSSWWRFFELIQMADDELFDEPEPIGRLQHNGIVGVNRVGNDIHRYSFPAQEHKVGARSELYDPRLQFPDSELSRGRVDKDGLTLDLVWPPGWDGPHPASVVPHDRIPIAGLQDALLRVGEWVFVHGIDSPLPDYRPVRDLILRRAPRLVDGVGGVLVREGEAGSDAARRLGLILDGTTLPIQGPPGSGKTYTGARMILLLVRDGRRVGITGSGHKVIRNLLDEVFDAAREEGMEVRALQRVDGDDPDPPPWQTAKDNGRFDRLLAKEEPQVLAGTPWLFAREQMAGSQDTLFVDEAGQVALANVVAMGGSARNIVLLGDPQQLDQVLQGAHPIGAGQSALGHFLGSDETVRPECGVFLERTWRMHPEIYAYTSELFYEGRLDGVDGLAGQRVVGDDWLSGSGLRWVPVEHDGNTNVSVEEADRVAEIWKALLGRRWVDRSGDEQPITPDDIVIVSPFNAHRLLIQARLPDARVGTVDKFQGQEAAVSIYTMATSRPEDAPRGIDFLYSLNRLNVATSRARGLAIVIASPALLRAVPRTPLQLRMANGLCAFAEAAANSPARARSGRSL
jgi:predicted RecB family nuclease